MTVPPLDPRVVDEIRRLAAGDDGIAEIWRRVRPRLEARGLQCPSYSAVRRIVVDERRERARPAPPSTSPVGVDWWAGRIVIR